MASNAEVDVTHEAENWEQLQSLSLNSAPGNEPACTSQSASRATQRQPEYADRSHAAGVPPVNLEVCDPAIKEALSTSREIETTRMLINMVENFVEDSQQEQLVFQPGLTSFQRMLAHRIAQHYGCQTKPHQSRAGPTVMAVRTEHTRFPEVRLSTLQVDVVEDAPEPTRIVLKRQMPSHGAGMQDDAAGTSSMPKTAEEKEEEYNRVREKFLGNNSRAQHAATANGNDRASRRPNWSPGAASPDGSGKAAFRNKSRETHDPDYRRGMDRFAPRFDTGYMGDGHGSAYMGPTYQNQFPSLAQARPAGSSAELAMNARHSRSQPHAQQQLQQHINAQAFYPPGAASMPHLSPAALPYYMRPYGFAPGQHPAQAMHMMQAGPVAPMYAAAAATLGQGAFNPQAFAYATPPPFPGAMAPMGVNGVRPNSAHSFPMAYPAMALTNPAMPTAAYPSQGSAPINAAAMMQGMPAYPMQLAGGFPFQMPAPRGGARRPAAVGGGSDGGAPARPQHAPAPTSMSAAQHVNHPPVPQHANQAGDDDSTAAATSAAAS